MHLRSPELEHLGVEQCLLLQPQAARLRKRAGRAEESEATSVACAWHSGVTCLTVPGMKHDPQLGPPR